MLKYMFLNNFRELKKIIINKFNISDKLANIIIQLYYIASFGFSMMIAYFSITNKLVQIYFLILSSWIIISLPKCNKRIKYMSVLNQIIKEIVLVPVVIVSVLMNPIISVAIILLAIVINKFFYYKIIKAIKLGYGNCFLLICTLLLILLHNIWVFIFYSLLSIIFYFKFNEYMNQKIYVDGITSFLLLFLAKEYITKYDKFGVILIGLYLVFSTRNAIFCQQEQFYNIKKSFLNLETIVEKKFNIICNYDYKLILSYVIIHFPLTFIIVYYKTNNIIYTIILSLLISILQSNLYFNLLLYGTLKFLKENTLIYNMSDLLTFRFSPLFVLASIPLVSIYYLYALFELKVVVVLSALIVIVIITSIFNRFKLKKVIINTLEE